ncbi:hypothetical protein P378_12000 [Desulforamulus profundi]|uniref:HTH cro/C1-type domain-containing protein n=1 Tax=Desulforamulus profundi TaxID=1383067 RepID=A0A2C6MDA2_9FIRM|nr:helix-turn-helix transcriptional regulator [Desulforamulus profundi]PHJ38058.1 hypothetical protein P378_12000 [Desulforamulus profundi]
MFGKRIKELRVQHNMTQSDLARLLKVSPSTIGMYEQGRRDPDTDTINFLADFFNVSADYLLGRTDIPNNVNDEPTPQELEKVLREANIAFDGAPLDEEDKEDVIEFVKVASGHSRKGNGKKHKKKLLIISSFLTF